MSLTSPTLLAVVAVLALLFPIGLAITWRMGPGGVVGGFIRFVGILLCQLLAIGAIGLYANNTFGFYDDWDDVLGVKAPPPAVIDTAGLVAGDGSQGRVVTISVPIPATNPVQKAGVLVWLPKQYDDPANQSQKFPVLMVLPGQPSNPQDTMHAFDFASYASHQIDTGKVKPFIAVFPPIMIAPPRDTECTDIPNGPQAETWLAKSVRNAVVPKFRVDPAGAKWSVMGFSTGGFCAAKVMLRNRNEFSAAVSVGGYFDAETDPTTGELFGGSQQLRNENSPIWLVGQAPTTKTNLLIVVSKQDSDSWAPGAAYADSSKMIAATAKVPGVQSMVLPSGGHNYSTYTPSVGAILQWLGKAGSI
ncbi:alpha/beta hydrolase [Microlunatus ginsengisoli]|uniref:Alpha/beta hydrolase-fold protein n=1 Tax=Microlunatus ginsengisoli TaxID=363863 RepID=A0ABP7AV92_9ACTN